MSAMPGRRSAPLRSIYAAANLMRCKGGAFRALRPGRGLRRIGLRGRGLPAAGRRGDDDGVLGLRFGRKGLDGELGRGQRLRVETLGDVVALGRGVGIALGRREAEPFEGFGEVRLDADTAGVENAEVELAVG